MAQKRLELSAEKRTIIGKKVRTLRREKKIPAHIFGKKSTSASLTLDAPTFEKIFRKVGSTSLIDVVVTGEKEPRPALVVSVQRHPVTDQILHVDLHQVDLTEKVTASIPVKLVGESPAVKDKGAVLITVLSEIKVEALPTDLPEHVEVDVSGLVDFGNSILVKDLSIDRKTVHVVDAEGETVVATQEPKQEVEETPTPVTVVEGEEAGVAAAAATAGTVPAEVETKTGQKPEEKKERVAEKPEQEAPKKK